VSKPNLWSGIGIVVVIAVFLASQEIGIARRDETTPVLTPAQ
jgi:hypothetical protein